MSQDPFSAARPNPDHTVVIPSPRGRSAGVNVEPSPADASTLTAHVSGLNPLIAAANPLLNLVVQLRATMHHPDPAGLRDALARDIKAFEARAHAVGISRETLVGARYALCTLLDEVASSTPWGSGVWAKQSLLVMFHNETWGGEKFFVLLARLTDRPGNNRDLLELLYVCLALGFEGRYRVLQNGKSQLEAVREHVSQVIRSQSTDPERDLSPAWQPTPVKRQRLFMIMPLWVSFATCGAILLGIFLLLSYKLNVASDPVYAKIQTIRVAAGDRPKPVARAPAPQPRLAGLLKDEIAQGLVAVRDEVDRSVVTIVGDALFAPGSGTITPSYDPLLIRIGEELNRVPGNVTVTGHTDNQPIRSVRFPSNWHLSQERARSVAQRLATRIDPARVHAEGRADSEPVASNDTLASRARNRRVEITLLATK